MKDQDDQPDNGNFCLILYPVFIAFLFFVVIIMPDEQGKDSDNTGCFSPEGAKG